MAALFNGGANGSFQVPCIVQCIENTNNINTVRDRFLYEVFHDVVGIMTVAEDVLSTEQHLQFCVFNVAANGAETLPRIFVEEAQAGIKGGTAPCFQSVIADFIEVFEDREHFFRRHTGRGKRLMRVTQDGFGNQYF